MLPTPVKREERYWAYICGATDIYLPEPVTRIEKYLGAICGGMILLPEPITKEEIYLYKIAKQREAVVKSVEGKTITMTDSLEAPFEDFHIYGHSTQETTTGKNLLNPDEIVIGGVVGNTGADWVTAARIRTGYIPVIPGGNYMLSGYDFAVDSINAYGSDKEWITQISPTNIIIPDAVFFVRIHWKKTDLQDFTDEELAEFKSLPLQFEKGTKATAYEPYTGGKPSPNPDYPQEIVSVEDNGNIDVSVTDGENSVQTLAISTPNGLPGIPVTSGGNYTDENGQQWVCDEIDFARGKYVQRVKRNTFDGSEDEKWKIHSNNGYYIRPEPNMKAAKGDPGYCDTFSILSSFSKNGVFLGYENQVAYFLYMMDDYAATPDEWRTFLSEHPTTIQYILETPIETDLTSEQIEQYKTLHTNTPTTIVSNDADAWMKVGYKAKPVSKYDEAKTLEWLKGE